MFCNSCNHNDNEGGESKKEKTIKTRYCKYCGSIVDNKTKICTGCGKKYFRWIRFTKILTVIALILVIIATSTLCVLQYVNTQNLKEKISDLENENQYLLKENGKKEVTINSLQMEIDDLNDENLELLKKNWYNSSELEFYEEHAVMVNENSEKYHKYGCADFDQSYFGVYDVELAKLMGYSACPKCHQT